MSRPIGLVCLCALLASSSIEAARILAVFPTPSISHQVVFRPLALELVRRGHEVVLITTDPAFPKGQAPENLTEIDVHDISYEVWRKLVNNLNLGRNNNDPAKQASHVILTVLGIFEQQTTLPEVQEIIRNKDNSFDLLIVEAWLRPALGYSHVVKAPVIAMSSFGAALDNYNVIGAPTHPLIYPQMQPRLFNLTLWEKLKILYNWFSVMIQYEKLKVTENAVGRRIFGDDLPDVGDLQNDVDMFFVNMYPLWEGNRPVPPSVVYGGGLHQKPEKELPQDLKKYLDSSAHGVIYLSFGTNIDSSALPADKIQTIIKVFSHLPYDVLWKCNQDELPGRTKNIKISKWLPQSDLLRHPKIKLFITQGGLQSTDETIIAGVPVIGIPMWSDQWYNVEKCVQFKIGKRIDLADIEEESFKSAVRAVIEDPSYRDNVVRLRGLLRDLPSSALQRAARAPERALRRDRARRLRAPAANMGFAEYYDVPLVLAVLCTTTAAITLALFVSYQMLKWLREATLRTLHL